MDSINLLETQSTSLNCRNTASNTNPIACACCGSNDYIQSNLQAFCFKGCYPGMPKCEHSQDRPEENLVFQQPFFPSFPFFHPLFHNSTIPANFCCVNNHSENKTVNGEQKQSGIEHEKTPKSTNQYKFTPKEVNDCRENKSGLNENPSKNSEFSRTDNPFLGHPMFSQNLSESPFSYLQRCGCSDSLPWSFSPFIAPIVSYCLFWNSQKANTSIKPPNFNYSSSETSSYMNDENTQNQKYSRTNIILDMDKDTENCTGDDTNSIQGDSLKIDQNLKNKVQSDDSSNSLPLRNYKNSEKEEDSNRYSKNDSESTCVGEEDEEDTEVERFDSPDQIESDECLNLDEKDLSNYNRNSYLSIESKDLKTNESLSLMESRSQSDLKTRRGSTNSINEINLEMQVNSSDNSTTGENVFFSQDQTNVLQITETAASGDLGGSHCVAYKVSIASLEEMQKETVRPETPTDEKPRETISCLGGAVEKQNFTEKNTNENQKRIRSFKSGIAKFSSNVKQKQTSADLSNNTKVIKEFNTRESSVTKRKHSCFPSDNNGGASNNNNSKILKTRNCTVAHEKTTVSEEQQKNSKNQPHKRDEKISLPKGRLTSNIQKIVKFNYKK